jgi:multidrug efflux pump subunit AcrA (membrane-fusion protein)
MAIKRKTKLIIAAGTVAAVAVVAVVLVLFVFNGSASDEGADVRTKPLTVMTLADTVGVTGTVESRQRVEVYSPVASLPVKAVNVQVGDTVKSGDVLCRLDTESLETDIAQQEAQIAASQATSGESIETARQRYDNAVYNYNNGLNASVNSAKVAAESARVSKERAERAYNDAKPARETAQAALDQAQAAYDTDPGQTNSDALAEARTALDQATQAEAQAFVAAQDAQTAYGNALGQQATAVNAAEQEIAALSQAVDTSYVQGSTAAQQIALEEMQTQLGKATITAPSGGTVTAVNATPGVSATGVLVVIEDPDGLQVKTVLEEYDVNRVKPGMAVHIQADGTGDAVYEGRLIRVAPTAATATGSGGAAASAYGSSAGSGADAGYEAIVEVTSKETALKLGMGVRMNIVLDQKVDVLAVPFDAVAQDAAGGTVVYVATEDTDGKMVYEAVRVTTGMETDFYVEVSGAGLKAGMAIVTNPEVLAKATS